MRIHNAESSQSSWMSPTVLLDPGTAYEDIETASERALWGMVQSSVPERARPTPMPEATARRSSSCVDPDGNIAVGTHTIGNSTNWGSGIFVGGIPLSNCGQLASWPRPGRLCIRRAVE